MINLLNIFKSKLKTVFEYRFLLSFLPFVKVIGLVSVVNFNIYATGLKQITLGIGQVTEISLNNVLNYSISNKEVLSSKSLQAQSKLIIKGKMQGHSIVTLWLNSGNKKTFEFYVLSKSGQFKVLEALNNLRHFDINGEIKGDKLIITQDITTLDQYLVLRPLLSKNKSIIFKGELKDQVAKKIIAEIHHHFFQNYYDDIRCQKNKIDIHCFTNEEILKDIKFLKPLQNKLMVKFFLSQRFENILNHKLEMRIIQIERMDGKEINFGLDQVDVGLADLLDEGASALAKSQSIVLRDTDYNVSTLATQKILLRTSNKTTVQMGSDIPFTTTTNNNGNNTQWRFAGLKIEILLEKINNRYKVKYATKLTRPMRQMNGDTYINGSAQESSFLIEKGIPIQMFEIDLTTDDNAGRRLPILGQVPILGKLFSSSTKFKTYKRIIAIAKLK